MTLWYTKNYSPTPHFPFESFLRNPDKILFDPMTQEIPSKYPLTNIGYANNTLIFEVALAGFKKENIKVSYVGNVITVNAKWNKDTEEEVQTCPQCEAQGCSGSCCSCDCCKKEVKYIMKNISTKDACRKFTLPDKYLGGSLKWKFVDGLLTIAVYVNDVDYSVEPSEDNEDLIPDCGCGCGCSQGCLGYSGSSEPSGLIGHSEQTESVTQEHSEP